MEKVTVRGRVIIAIAQAVPIIKEMVARQLQMVAIVLVDTACEAGCCSACCNSQLSNSFFMKKRGIYIFIQSSGILFLLTAIAKLISITAKGRILYILDPVFHVPFRHLLCAVAVAELVVAAICLFSKNRKLQAGLIAMLATNFVLYRFGLYWQGYYGGCHCWGNLTDALHIPPQTADTAMKIILVYLLIGSYATLFWLWRQKRKAEGRMQNEEI